ncbi:hypothetical protein EHR01_06390 [Leptospira mtsangambouensis]|uniref:Uncharacterized protein n=1 Tax=Leptospira mtsangambouensis TaxID=2484912 RepID=A0ABY2P4J8_9LEPT|nr:hypothetical protein EHR01_06390 [Leptospira mtsangambouensis]
MQIYFYCINWKKNPKIRDKKSMLDENFDSIFKKRLHSLNYKKDSDSFFPLWDSGGEATPSPNKEQNGHQQTQKQKQIMSHQDKHST